jgi:phosphotriesterase-related protein
VATGSAAIMTVTGPVAPEDLGFTLMHEHVVLRTPGFAENYPSTYPRDDVLARSIEQLTRLRAKGVRTIVDHTTVDLGRDAGLLRKASEQAGMNIVTTTGSYHHGAIYFRPRTAEAISKLFIGDIVDGVADTGARAGVVKCAVDQEGMTPLLVKLAEAAALTQRATGALISTHSHPGSGSGIDQAKVLRDAGADPAKVVIGHSGDSTDLTYLRALLFLGVTIGLDRFGLDEFLDTESRCAVLAQLCAEGFASQLVVSQDAFVFNDSVSTRFRESQLPDWRLDFLVDEVLDRLNGLGVTDDDIHAMTVTNPARLLAMPIAT